MEGCPSGSPWPAGSVSGFCNERREIFRRLLKSVCPESGILRCGRVPYRSVEDVNVHMFFGPRKIQFLRLFHAFTTKIQLGGTSRQPLALLLMGVALVMMPSHARSQTVFPGSTVVGLKSVPLPVVVTMTASGDWTSRQLRVAPAQRVWRTLLASNARRMWSLGRSILACALEQWW